MKLKVTLIVLLTAGMLAGCNHSPAQTKTVSSQPTSKVSSKVSVSSSSASASASSSDAASTQETASEGTENTDSYTGAGTGGINSEVANVVSGKSSSSALMGFFSATGKRWQLVWHDEFDSASLNQSIWKPEVGYVRSGEPQYYTNYRADNCRVDGGNLVIEARKDNYEYAAGKTAQYTSASITTKNTMQFKYGKLEIRAKLPDQHGAWPAFWTMGNDVTTQWPSCGEIDVMEALGNTQKEIFSTLHWAGGTATDHRQDGVGFYLNDGVSVSNDFHIYGMEWDKDKIVCYFDNKIVHTFDITSAAMNPEFQQAHYVLLNLALHDTAAKQPTTWNNNHIDSTTQFPFRYVIDYIRLYKER